MENDFNPSERKDREMIRKKNVAKALKILDEADHLTEYEWDKLKRVFYKVLQRDFVRWLKEREGQKT